ncbi:hypothetical protein Emed_006305 [Eimeria media]
MGIDEEAGESRRKSGRALRGPQAAAAAAAAVHACTDSGPLKKPHVLLSSTTAAATAAAAAATAAAATAAAAAARMSFPYYTEFGVHYPTYIPPKDQADRLVDPKKKLAPACTTKCSIWVHEYSLLLLLLLLPLSVSGARDACCDRLKARTDNRGNCSGQFEELQTCVDRCVAKNLFNYLK